MGVGQNTIIEVTGDMTPQTTTIHGKGSALSHRLILRRQPTRGSDRSDPISVWLPTLPPATYRLANVRIARQDGWSSSTKLRS